MESILLRRAIDKDAKDFVNFVLYTAGEFFLFAFGPDVKTILKKLFAHPFNLFSHTHCYTIEYEGKVAGMILSYAFRGAGTIQETFWTGFLLMKFMGGKFFRRLGIALKLDLADWLNLLRGVLDRNYYISNVAIYPEFRGFGLGTRLMAKAEEEARISGVKKCALDVESENAGAIRLYKKMGYKIQWQLKSIHVLGEKFSFYRMAKFI